MVLDNKICAQCQLGQMNGNLTAWRALRYGMLLLLLVALSGCSALVADIGEPPATWQPLPTLAPYHTHTPEPTPTASPVTPTVTPTSTPVPEVPTATAAPIRLDATITPEIVAGLLGIVRSLPDTARFDDYFSELRQNIQWGIAPANEAAENALAQARDSGRAVRVWGRVEHGVDDYGGTRIVVERVEFASPPPSRSPGETATATPTPEEAPSPTNTPEALPSPTATPEALLSPTATLEALSSPTATLEALSSPTATPEALPSPTAIPEALPSPTATPEALPSPTATLEALSSPTATPEALPSPTATPEALPSPTATLEALPSPKATIEIRPEMTPTPRPQMAIVEDWLGMIRPLPAGSRYAHYFAARDEEGQYGITSTLPPVEEQLRLYRDSGALVRIWGILEYGVDDYGGARIYVTRVEAVD
jgi:hypothetical protein